MNWDRLKQLFGREYLPMIALIAMWAVIVVAIGHADAARLLAAITFIRAAQMLTRLSTASLMRKRIRASRDVRRQAKRLATEFQLMALIAALLTVAAISEGLKAVGQYELATYLPFVAIGMPARYIRQADVKTASRYFRLALSGSGLVMVSIGWAAGLTGLAMAFAFGAREWIAYMVMRLWPKPPFVPRRHIAEPLTFAEVAMNSAVVSRRMLTYRLSKTLLAAFGPFGNMAARTGRELKWHRKIEPYLPHHLGGFILFTVVTLGGGAMLATYIDEPAAMIAAAAMWQVGMATFNVVLLWRWLPERPEEVDDEDDDD
ncbi:hypothetical protein [Sphingomonas xanthus]|uniref:Uncharacterized protein n=1 Tax=Sphingomonas xanthus TaxID=2594473 RepID=A0A516ISU1_9SPHN|nr:hypothetical protein [Sphingomonas xanthus]QDP19961.1 hypothetical protein FMM02_08335 [Sphingomonas xanthus]